MSEWSRPPYGAVVMGASSGGVQALKTVLGGLDRDFQTPVIIVLHTGAQEVTGLCEIFSNVAPGAVLEAQERHPVEPGRVYIAPSGYHLLVEKSSKFALSVDEKVCYVRPAVDVLFESAAEVWGSRLIGVILTGANEDGANGLRAIRHRRGLGIVQSLTDAQAVEMPSAALQRAGADYVAPLTEIGPLLSRLCRGDTGAIGTL